MIFILPVLTAVMSPRSSRARINPYFVTKQNAARRHHRRVAAALPAKSIRATCAQRCCSFFSAALHSRAVPRGAVPVWSALLCSVLFYSVLGCSCATTAPPCLPLFLALGVSSWRRGVSQVAYWKVKPRCAHSLTMRQVALPPSPPPSLPPRAVLERDAHAHAPGGERRRETEGRGGRESAVLSVSPLLLPTPATSLFTAPAIQAEQTPSSSHYYSFLTSSSSSCWDVQAVRDVDWPHTFQLACYAGVNTLMYVCKLLLFFLSKLDMKNSSFSMAPVLFYWHLQSYKVQQITETAQYPRHVSMFLLQQSLIPTAPPSNQTQSPSQAVTQRNSMWQKSIGETNNRKLTNNKQVKTRLKLNILQMNWGNISSIHCSYTG